MMRLMEKTMSDQKTPTADDRMAYVADMLIDLAILLRGGRPTTEGDAPPADTEPA